MFGIIFISFLCFSFGICDLVPKLCSNERGALRFDNKNDNLLTKINDVGNITVFLSFDKFYTFRCEQYQDQGDPRIILGNSSKKFQLIAGRAVGFCNFYLVLCDNFF